VSNYLTFTGAGRTVELGAFLSEEERLELKPEIEDALRRLAQVPVVAMEPGPVPDQHAIASREG
jgi:hypothetical protein